MSELEDVHINWTRPQRVLDVEELGVRWCFDCRARRDFTETITADIEPSYYEPCAAVRCSRGHEDGDLFPGRYREYV